ncbi:MAG: tetratricopeptide repeat protein [Alphaproteobacteria bacterium]|nr:tetratricopeptide repeat protein [Alphaproteobacteria bacterium]
MPGNHHLTKGYGLPARAFALGALLLLGAGCATGGGQPVSLAQSGGASTTGARAESELEVGVSPFGNYLAGRHALNRRDVRAAAAFLERTLAGDPDNPELLGRALRALVGEGKVTEAAAVARRLLAQDPKAPLAAVVGAVETARTGAHGEAYAGLEGTQRQGFNALLVPLLQAWFRVGTGSTDAAIAALEPLKARAAFKPFLSFHRALILDLADASGAEEAYREALQATSASAFRVVEAYSQFLLRQGKAAQAQALLRQFREKQGDSVWAQAAEAMGDGKVRPVPDAAAGLAEVLFGVASALNQERGVDEAQLHLRLALHLRPDFAPVWLLLGEVLDVQDRHSEAVAAFARVPVDSALGWTARLRIASKLEQMNRTEEALKHLAAMITERPDRSDAAVVRGDILRAKDRWAEAVADYDLAMGRIGELQDRHWSLLYARGIALERSKRWPRAEDDFLKALKLQPEQPLVLNYLGYSWVEQGINLDRAKQMIERAVQLRPNDGYIVDSLGWALYRLGDYDRAVQQLERAVELRTEDAVINDHLGDAYWRVGRLIEARFQWQRALTSDPEPAVLQEIQRKLREGLIANRSGSTGG